MLEGRLLRRRRAVAMIDFAGAPENYVALDALLFLSAYGDQRFSLETGLQTTVTRVNQT
jgi:hypothetical protein